MTIICCLPSFPVGVFWHLLTPFQCYICAYATPRDEPPQVAEASANKRENLQLTIAQDELTALL